MINYIRAEEMERNSRNQVKDEQELAFQEAQVRDQQREVRRQRENNDKYHHYVVIS